MENNMKIMNVNGKEDCDLKEEGGGLFKKNWGGAGFLNLSISTNLKLPPHYKTSP